MVFFAIGIQCDQSGCPLDVKIIGQWLSIMRYLKGNHALLNEFNHGRIWIRNRIHLFAANSIGVMEKKQDLLILPLSTR